VKADAAHSSSRTLSDVADEQQLILQLRGGQREALERVIALNHERVSRLVARLVGWNSDREDVVQEVFLLALRGARRFRGDSRISTWLTRIAINVCRSHHRKRLLRARFWKTLIAGQPEEPLDLDEPSMPQDRRERIMQVTQAMQRLKPAYREVIVLHYLEEMPAEEIRQILGISRNMVEVRLHRARKMLEEMLEE
jgi:RNA polymerase sigma-70 factor, ECF subfamily